ncbi:MAG: tetratricopeptide repeat protein [Alphaproteobacteria bacterium]|nr:tetratricopeptide repeat protein [Alphaproteobacteria bacterium]
MKMPDLLQKSSDFYNKGDYDSAWTYIENFLQQAPDNPSALIIKGNILYQKQKLSEAFEWYQKALSIDSKNTIAWINCANICFENKDYVEAFMYAGVALGLDNRNKNALTLYGNAALELEKYDEAKTSFLRILEQDSQDYWCYNSLSQLYQKTEDYERALACGWRAVELSKGDENQHINFGYMLYEISQFNYNLVQPYAKNWLEKYPTDSVVMHMANAVLHNQNLTRADGKYIQEIFDIFADDFENVLADLGYCVPQLFENELAQIFIADSPVKLKILDAGCGTGLCGPFLKKYACLRGLYGLDLSREMLKRAAQKNVYDQLICQDFELYLKETKQKFDLIVAADVFTYFGELQNLVIGCQKNLNKNGRILFSVSANNENDSDYYLHASGRFLHHRKYIERILSNNGLEIEKIGEHVLRTEGEKQVWGYIVSAFKK